MSQHRRNSFKESRDGHRVLPILDIDDLEIFENVAYIMAWHADPSIPGTIDEWLEDFEMFSIYEILPEILKLWGDNLITQVDVKKNRQRAVGK